MNQNQGNPTWGQYLGAVSVGMVVNIVTTAALTLVVRKIVKG